MSSEAPSPRCVAAFDFDGTLLSGDSLLPFLRRAAGWAGLGRAAIRASWQLALLPLGGVHRDRAKAALLAASLAGRSAETVRQIAEEYSGELSRRLRADTRRCLEWHLAEGHEVLLVSASPSLYLEPLAQQLGIHHTIATELAEVDGRLTGRIVGVNVRGPHKARLIADWLGDVPRFLYAYGDSAGDRELLAKADHAVWVARGVVGLPTERPTPPGQRRLSRRKRHRRPLHHHERGHRSRGHPEE